MLYLSVSPADSCKGKETEVIRQKKQLETNLASVLNPNQLLETKPVKPTGDKMVSRHNQKRSSIKVCLWFN